MPRKKKKRGPYRKKPPRVNKHYTTFTQPMSQGYYILVCLHTFRRSMSISEITEIVEAVKGHNVNRFISNLIENGYIEKCMDTKNHKKYTICSKGVEFLVTSKKRLSEELDIATKLVDTEKYLKFWVDPPKIHSQIYPRRKP